MSRKKSPPRNKPELVREGLTPALPAEAQATVHRLTGELHDVLEAIIAGCALSARSTEILDAASAELPDSDLDLVDLDDDENAELGDDEIGVDALDDAEPSDDEPSDEEIEAGIGELGMAFASVELTRRLLARALLARTLDLRRAQTGPTLTRAGSDVDGKALAELVQPLLPSNLPPELQLSRAEHREAFGEAAFLIREVGLEEFDVSCDLTTAWDLTPELFAHPVSPETAHVMLLEVLFDRAESVALNLDPLLDVERQASGWEFWRWSVAPPPGHWSPEVVEFARVMREQEYSLADRRTITLGRSVMSDLAADEGFAELFPRQHRMAAALAASFVDVFECVALEGHRATLQSMRDGRTYTVHEHTEPIEYASGWVAAGRLLPFDGDVHLRSPGMIFFQPEDPEFVRSAAQALGKPAGTLAPALELEAFISSAVFDVRVPRTEKPARSRADARDMLATLEVVLAGAELVHEALHNDVDAAQEGAADEQVAAAGEIRLDATLEAFMMALAEQATAGKPRDTHRRAQKKKKKTKRRR